MVNDLSLFYETIKERICSVVPGTYSSDFFSPTSTANYEGEKASIPLYFRHFEVKTTSSTENDFSGNYAYQSKTIGLIINLYYSQQGACRVLGDSEIDFNSFALGDVEDVQSGLIQPLQNDSGSTARLIRRGAQIDTVDSIIVVSISYDLVCFLAGTQQLPALYLGPNIETTQDAGNPQYVVALSDKNCNATLAANKAGLTFTADLVLIANQPQIIEVTGTEIDSWTLTLTALGQTATCTYQIYAGSAVVNQIVPVVTTDSMAITGSTKFPILFCKNPGTVELTSSDPTIATVTPNIVVPGNVEYQNGFNVGDYLARQGCLQSRDQTTLCFKIHNNMYPGTTTASGAYTTNINLAKSFQIENARRVNWHLQLSKYGLSNAIVYRQSVDNLTNEAAGTTAYQTYTTRPEYIYLIWIMNATGITYYMDDKGPLTLARSQPVGTMGGTEYIVMMAGMEWAKYDRVLDANDIALFRVNHTFPSNPAALYSGGHEIVASNPTVYDFSGNDLDLTAIQFHDYWPPAGASGQSNIISTVEPWQDFTITPLQAGTVTITAKRRRAGIPDRATENEKYETVSSTVTVAI